MKFLFITCNHLAGPVVREGMDGSRLLAVMESGLIIICDVAMWRIRRGILEDSGTAESSRITLAPKSLLQNMTDAAFVTTEGVGLLQTWP